jgi:hypothetical protein
MVVAAAPVNATEQRRITAKRFIWSTLFVRADGQKKAARPDFAGCSGARALPTKNKFMSGVPLRPMAASCRKYYTVARAAMQKIQYCQRFQLPVAKSTKLGHDGVTNEELFVKSFVVGKWRVAFPSKLC